jgi:hypothetical protein
MSKALHLSRLLWSTWMLINILQLKRWVSSHVSAAIFPISYWRYSSYFRLSDQGVRHNDQAQPMLDLLTSEF